MKPSPVVLHDCGLLQFGLIGDAPLCLRPELLPSYPGLLRQLAEVAVRQVSNVDRLLAVPDAHAWGIAAALASGLPLVSSRGTTQAPSRDLVGAYDIGHPTLLLVSEVRSASGICDLARRARTVGLELRSVLALLGHGQDQIGQLPVTALYSLPEVLDELVSAGVLPTGHAQQVRRWLPGRRQAAAGP